MLLTAIIVILAFIIVKILLNAYKLWRIQAIDKIWKTYIYADEGKKTWDIYQYKKELIQLFKDAGIKNVKIQEMRPAGYNHVAPVTIDYFDNITALTTEIVHFVKGSLEEARGVFRRRLFDAINPIYWIEFIIFLPQHCFVYLNLNNNKYYPIIKNAGNFLYWIIGLAVSILKLYRTLKGQ